MPKSPGAAKVGEVAAAVHTLLKPRGFTKQGHTFNRTTADGLVQVVNVQMGRHDPPGTQHIPGLRENLHGSFTINLGIFVPEVERLRFGPRRADTFVAEVSCTLRVRLGQLARDRTDRWWRVGVPAKVIPDVLKRLERHGLPFLARFESRAAILRTWRQQPHKLRQATPVPRLVLALIAAKRGNLRTARAWFLEQARSNPAHGHPAYVRDLARRAGVPFEVPRRATARAAARTSGTRGTAARRARGSSATPTRRAARS